MATLAARINDLAARVATEIKSVRAAIGGKLDAAHAGTGGSAHPVAVAGGAAGFMSGADKTKLDGVASGATANTVATAANVRAASGDGVVSAGGIANSAAEVALSDATTIAVNWTAFVNAAVTLAGNRTLGNPTNVVAGTTRTIYVAGNNTTARSLAFGSNFKGDLPTLSDITNAKAYLLTLYARSATHIVVSHVRAL